MIDWNKIDERKEATDYSEISATYIAMGGETNFSPDNVKYLQRYFKKVKRPQVILEIGVDNNKGNASSTKTFLDIKKDDTYYFGVDLEPKTHLDNPEKRIFTIQQNSQFVDEIMQKVLDLSGLDKIDFLFIDGWHSVKQCRMEWEGYTPYLAPGGVVGVHDTNYHWGPMWLFEKHIDFGKWAIARYGGAPGKDFGIGFAWRHGEIS